MRMGATWGQGTFWYQNRLEQMSLHKKGGRGVRDKAGKPDVCGPWQGLNVSQMGGARSNHGGHPHAVLEKVRLSAVRQMVQGAGNREFIKGGETWAFSVWLGSVPQRGWTCRRAKRGWRCCQRLGLRKPGGGSPAGDAGGPPSRGRRQGQGWVWWQELWGLCFRFLPGRGAHSCPGRRGRRGPCCSPGDSGDHKPRPGAGVGGRHGFSFEASALPSRRLTEAGEWGGGQPGAQWPLTAVG